MKLKMNLDCSRIIVKEIMIVSGIFVKGRSFPCDNFIVTRVVFAKLSRILPTPLVFISGYANMQNIFYYLIVTGGTTVDVHVLYVMNLYLVMKINKHLKHGMLMMMLKKTFVS